MGMGGIEFRWRRGWVLWVRSWSWELELRAWVVRRWGPMRGRDGWEDLGADRGGGGNRIELNGMAEFLEVGDSGRPRAHAGDNSQWPYHYEG